MSNDRFKFRQWLNGRWHYWGYCVEDGCFVGPITSSVPNPINNQWTGLHDKNGVEIYEGDVLDHPEFDYPIKIQWDKDESRFDSCGCPSEWSFCRVIGNEWENPSY